MIRFLSVFHCTALYPSPTNFQMFITLEVQVILTILFARLVLSLLRLLFMLTSKILTTSKFQRQLQWILTYRKPVAREKNLSGLKKATGAKQIYRKSLSQMVSIVSDAFFDIGLSLDIDKWEFFPYNCTTATPLHRNNFTIPLVDCWLGISITNTLLSLRQCTVCDIKQFVVTNCSKERPGSVINETLNNGILILRDTLKESDI